MTGMDQQTFGHLAYVQQKERLSPLPFKLKAGKIIKLDKKTKNVKSKQT